MKQYKKLLKELKRVERIAIFIHEYPDGDAVGSSSALFYYLKSKGKHVELFSQDPIPQNMKWVECCEEYQTTTDLSKTFDIGVLIDCSDANRPGAMALQTKTCANLIRIDHHPKGEECSEFDVVDTKKSSACELLAEILLTEKNVITKNIANSLLFGVLTDTNSLQNSNTTKRTVDIISMLMGAGAELNKLEECAFACKSFKEVEITKEFYKNMVVLPNEKIAYSYIGYDLINKIGATKEDMNGHANMLRNIDGIDLSFVLYQLEPNLFSCSLRSVAPIECNKIAGKFGGGGHAAASGFKAQATNMQEVIDQTLFACREVVKCQME